MQLLMRRPEIRGFISVAPPANIYDFSFLAPCPSSGLILQGSRDDVVPEAAVKKNLVDKLMAQKGIKIDYRVIEGANHFFHEKTDQLIANMHDHMDKAGGGRSLVPEKKETPAKKMASKPPAKIKEPEKEKIKKSEAGKTAEKTPPKTKSKKAA